MAKYDCPRCGVQCHTTDPEHLCKDVAARLKRRERQTQAVETILWEYDAHQYADRRDAAEAIVKVLANLNVEGD